MLQNPYTPGETPRFLAGRDRELSQIQARLDRVAEHGEMVPPLVFTAPRGLGKTSLLRTAAHRARPDGFVTAWVSCVRDQKFLPDLGASIGRALSALDSRADDRWRTRWESFQVEVGIPGIKASADFDRTERPSAPTGLVTALENLLHDAAELVRGRGGAGLLVLVDELHAPDDTAVFLNAVQNLSGERDDNPLAVIGAGLPSTPGHLTSAATFGERTTFVRLLRLEPDAATHALIAPAADLGVPWSIEALHLVQASADGYPYLLQLLGAATWDAAAPEPGTTLTADDVNAGAPAAVDQLASMFDARWRAATELEQSFMQAMATHGHDRVPRAAIAQALGRDTRAISTPRERLIDKGIIEADGHGHLRFTLPGFAGYIRGESGLGLDPPIQSTQPGRGPAPLRSTNRGPAGPQQP